MVYELTNQDLLDDAAQLLKYFSNTNELNFTMAPRMNCVPDKRTVHLVIGGTKVGPNCASATFKSNQARRQFTELLREKVEASGYKVNYRMCPNNHSLFVGFSHWPLRSEETRCDCW